MQVRDMQALLHALSRETPATPMIAPLCSVLQLQHAELHALALAAHLVLEPDSRVRCWTAPGTDSHRSLFFACQGGCVRSQQRALCADSASQHRC